jgi:eukaryotic-like serine/threonine-protein kinase
MSSSPSDVNQSATAPPAIPDYELLRIIGSGAYGEVWLARNCLGAWRALKIVYRKHFDCDRPYEREFAGVMHAEAISRTHPNHVAILHVGIDERSGCFYCVMELADDEETGQEIAPETYQPKSLQSELRRRRRLPAGECISVAIALAEAVAHLHSHGLVHRDIKPANIVYVRGQPRLTDIGLTCRADAGASVVGTDGFMAPEGPGSPAGDLFSLGKVLYEMATGFDRHNYPELPTFLPADTGREQRDLVELNQIILRACETDPSRRYRTARQLLEDLRLLQAGESVLRLRRMEQALLRLRRAMIAGCLILGAGVGAYFYQLHHTRIVATYAEENHRLAEQRRDDLIATLVDAGIRQLDEGARHHALLSFARALEAAEGDADRERPHRIRMHSLLAGFPRLIGVIEHGGWVRHAEFSPDGTRVVTASDDGTARIWNAGNGQAITPPLLHEAPVHWAHFSPLQDTVVTAGKNHRAGLWDLESGSLRAWLAHDEGEIFSASFSPDGDRIATAGADKTARIWSGDGRPLVPPLQHPDRVYTASFSPDGTLLLTTCRDGIARIWDAATGRKRGEEMTHGAPLSMAAFSSTGHRVVSVSPDGAAKVWDPRTGQLLTERKHARAVLGAVFSPCGRWVATGERENKSLFIWDAETGEVIQSFEGNLSAEPQFSPDGAFIAFSHYGIEARVANIRTGELQSTPLSAGWFDSARFSPDGHRLVIPSTREGVVKIWDLAAAGLPEIPSDQPVSLVHYSADGSHLVLAGAAAQVWRTIDNQPVTPPLPTASFVGLVDFSPDSRRLLTAGGPGFYRYFGNAWDHSHAVEVWDLATGEHAIPPIIPGSCTYHAAFSSDGRRILTAGAHGRAQVWDAGTGKLLLTLEHGESVWHAAWSPDARRIITCSGSTVRVWDASSGAEVLSPLVHEGAVDHAAYSPDGSWIVSAAFHPQVLSVWDAQTGLLKSSQTLPGEVGRFTIDDRGETLLTHGFGCASLRDLPSLGAHLPSLCHDSVMKHAAFRGDGKQALTVCENHYRVWDAADGHPLAAPLQRTDALPHARFLRRNPPRSPGAFHPSGNSITLLHGLSAARSVILLPDPRPARDLVQLAQVLGAEPRPRNSPPPQDHRAGLWQLLREQHPESFTTTPDTRWQWHEQMAHHLRKTGQLNAAAWHLNQAIELRPLDANLHTLRGRLHWARGDGPAAARDFQSAVRLRGTVADYHDTALALALGGDGFARADALQEMIETFKDSVHFPTLLLVMWASALSADLPPAVHEELAATLQQRFDSSHSRNPEVELILGATYYRAGKLQRAAHHLDRAVRFSRGEGGIVDRSTLPRTWAFLALVAQQDDRRHEALDFFDLLNQYLHGRHLPAGDRVLHELELLTREIALHLPG